MRLIQDLEREFERLKGTLVFPASLDFQGPEGIITIPTPSHPTSSSSSLTLGSSPQDVPKLSYTSSNYALHAYVESLNRLLMKLDSVESWGETKVRKNRKRVIGRIEDEASGVEAFWKRAWILHSAAPAARAGDSDGAIMNIVDEVQEEGELNIEPKEEKEAEKQDELEVQMMVADPEGDTVSSSPSHPPKIPLSTPEDTLSSRDDHPTTLDALPQLLHDDDDSSDSDLDFEDVGETPSDIPEHPMPVIVTSEEDRKEAVSVPLLSGETKGDLHLGEDYVMVL